MSLISLQALPSGTRSNIAPFSFISVNWRGKPLIDRATVVSLIANTTTATGLKIQAKLDERNYQTGIKVSDQEMKLLNLHQDTFHGEWNYFIQPH